MMKPIGNMNHYEILNVPLNASQREIERAYLLGKSTYREDSLAFYSFLKEEEREATFEKIEEAFQTLGDPEKRQIYDLNHLNIQPRYKDALPHRKTMKLMTIEDGETYSGFSLFLKKLFNGNKRKKREAKDLELR